MFINSRKFAFCANRLAARNISYGKDSTKNILDVPTAAVAKKLHTTTQRSGYAAAAALPLPNNIDAAETTRFSPNRSRDISATVILCNHTSMPSIDITADNSARASAGSGFGRDPHLQSYDCFGAVSLNSSMQSNVPTPFGGMHKFSHLNMPGGQWSQEYKFTSQNLHSSHYTNLREQARSDWVTYDQDATIDRKENAAAAKATTTINARVTNSSSSSSPLSSAILATCTRRSYSTQFGDSNEKPKPALTRKDQLKKAFKDYGATVIVFHVGISLMSLGACYLLVSGGVDMMAVMNYLGLSSTALSSKLANGASTFVVAYAIHKVFAPVRISITLGAAPFIVRFLRSKGYIKPNVKFPPKN